MNNFKLGLAILSVIGGVVAFYFLKDSATVVRLLGLLTGLIISIVVALSTNQGKQFYAFSKDSIEEAKKVVWPNKKETFQTAGAVFAFVSVMAMFLWLVDAGLMILVKYALDQEG
ncbi:MAG: preprotein translocase subunit SecE [Nitrosomonas sp.]|nr:preprotein translocase subunit SecE [Nitrosomonas sp.]MBK7365060.1 preprotein translocase subunit SecE [Nitrosomonas sp.]